EVGELGLEPFELSATISVTLDEDEAVEAGVCALRAGASCLEGEPRGPVEELLRFVGSEVGEEQVPGGRVLFSLSAHSPVAGARERVDVRGDERLVLERVDVRGEVVCEH